MDARTSTNAWRIAEDATSTPLASTRPEVVIAIAPPVTPEMAPAKTDAKTSTNASPTTENAGLSIIHGRCIRSDF